MFKMNYNKRGNVSANLDMIMFKIRWSKSFHLNCKQDFIRLKKCAYSNVRFAVEALRTREILFG